MLSTFIRTSVRGQDEWCCADLTATFTHFNTLKFTKTKNKAVPFYAPC